MMPENPPPENKTFQGYIHDFGFGPPPELPNVRSLVIAATPWKLHSVSFRSRELQLHVLVRSSGPEGR
jgi:hypothetical protein